MSFPDIHLRSVGTALPGPAIDNATLTRRFHMPSAWEQWIDAFVGTHQRHFAVDLDTGAVRYTLADLGVTAGQRAMDAAGLRASDIDVMVMGTASPDMLMPATVNVIADRLGVNDVPAYQLQSGCTGAVQALDVACHMLRSGAFRTALVLGGDTCAKHLDVSLDVSTLSPAEQINGVLFGDGAGAMILSTDPAHSAAVIRHVSVRLVGRGQAPGQTVAWFGRGDRDRQETPVVEDYKAIEERVPVLAADMLKTMLGALDWGEDDFDYLLPPQLSGRMTARIVDHLGMPHAHEVSCVAEIGNTGNALPFFQLERALPRMAGGERAVGIAIESSKWILAGFGFEKV